MELRMLPLLPVEASTSLRFEGELGAEMFGCAFQVVRIIAVANTGYSVTRFEIDGVNELLEPMAIADVVRAQLHDFTRPGRRFALEVERVPGAVAFSLMGYFLERRLS